jgi:hypothetical protein
MMSISSEPPMSPKKRKKGVCMISISALECE